MRYCMLQAIDAGAIAIIAEYRIEDMPSDFPVVYVHDTRKVRT